jgi:hypothetical protein
MKINIPFGDVIDRLTILQIKEEKLTNEDIKSSIKKEIKSISKKVTKDLNALDDKQLEKFDILMNKLSSINSELWDIENKIREKESQQVFDRHFIELARQVYHLNDERSNIKRTINELLHSKILEYKEYTHYKNSSTKEQ